MNISVFPLEILLFLFCIALVASFIDTLAGGGGLLTIPALIMSGIPPLFALGTNKIQSSTGSGTATLMMLRKKRIKLIDLKYSMLAAFLGSTIGTLTVQYINTEVLSYIIPIVLIIIAVYFLFSPKSFATKKVLKIQKWKFRSFVIPIIGCYDGMFGPGTGSFFAFGGVALQGQGIIDATATAKALNFATNIASAIIFIAAGKIFWFIAFIMICGQIIGAWLGSHSLLRINPQHLRYFVVLMCLIMLANYAISIL